MKKITEDKMTEKSAQKKSRNDEIRADFKKMAKEGYFKFKAYELLAEKYGLSVKMIQKIILNIK